MTDNTEQSVDFKLVVPISKSETEGGWYIRGIAAGIEPDKEGDVLLPQAITMLAEQINSGGVPLRNQHRVDSITEDLGTLVKATITPNWELAFEALLDEDNPESQYLWKKMGQGKQYGASVRGSTIGAYPDVDKATRRRVRKHPYVLLKELSVTTRPIYTPSLGTVIKKAFDEAESSSSIEGETMTTQNETVETQDQQSSAPETNAATDVKASQILVKSLLEDPQFAELVKSAVASATETISTESATDDSTEAPATQETVDVAELVKSTILATSAVFDAKLQAVLERIPESEGPGVLIKSEEEKIVDVLKEMSPRDSLRAGLAARHGELGKFTPIGG